MDLRQIYSQIIMEQSRSKRYRHELPHATAKERGFNPSCGDDICLSVIIEDERIVDIAFEGTGCAISQASTSLLCGLVKGKTVDEAKSLISVFLGMIQGDITDDEILQEDLGDAVALKNISTMPQRVSCAVLAWRTLDLIIAKERDDKRTE
ncbi:MAG TPA: SUF system NifU family Fe-S cluster assembly protein [Candidatus Eisenbacteria bacterium]|nr:SUF system NifU family Fe-S cluster assembly protein [Candidatus Eisenbacteria bacterium]